MMKKNVTPEPSKTPKLRYAKPEIVERGSIAERTLNSESGADPEGLEDNIVWGN